MQRQPQVDGRIAAVGYCFGGMTVLELARSAAELAGVVSVHGSLDTAPGAEAGSVKAKILVCHGALDPHVPTGASECVCGRNEWRWGRLAIDRLWRRHAWIYT